MIIFENRVLPYLLSLLIHFLTFIPGFIFFAGLIKPQTENATLLKIIGFLVLAICLYFSHRISRNLIFKKFKYIKAVKRAFFIK